MVRAEALYHQGSFEHALVNYFKALRHNRSKVCIYLLIHSCKIYIYFLNPHYATHFRCHNPENRCDNVKIGVTMLTLSHRFYIVTPIFYIVTPIFLHCHTDFSNFFSYCYEHNNHLVSTINDHLAIMAATFSIM